MKKFQLVIFFLLISLSSYSQGFSTQRGGHCYSLEIPDYMTRSYQLNNVASLQYQNTSREAYVIVIEDNKDHLESLGIKFIDSKDFLEDFMKDYKQGTVNRRTSDIQNFDSNGNEHAQVELFWNEDNMDFYMLITAVETATHFYKIMCWTTIEFMDKLAEDYRTISKSLKD